MLARRRLGRTGLSIHPLGFGAWGVGGATEGNTSYGATSDTTSLQALRAAFAAGVNFFDTAALYGYGKSEQLIGTAFQSVRDRVYIATKAGYLRYDQAADFSPASLQASLAASLQRLQTGYVDLFQLHNPAPELLLAQPEIYRTLCDLRDAGHIRGIGISVKSPEQALTILQKYDVDAVQVNFNMMDQRALDSGLFDTAFERGVSIIARTPLAFGFLSDAVGMGAQFPEGDHRRNLSTAQVERWVDGANRLFDAAGMPVGEPRSHTAIRFCLSFRAVTAVIPGMLTEQEVASNIAAANHGPLPDAVVESIRAAYRGHAFMAAAQSS
jgi:aryl-alcohol dehydrogenase-like predicted oxidoreductase